MLVIKVDWCSATLSSKAIIADIVAPGAVRNVNAEIIDASRRLIIPGLINAAAADPGRGIEEEIEFPEIADALGQAAVAMGVGAALINAVEHVEKGSTACYDLFFEFPAPSIEGMEAVANAQRAMRPGNAPVSQLRIESPGPRFNQFGRSPARRARL